MSNAIESAVRMAELMRSTELEISKLKADLEAKEKQLRQITQEDLPALLQEIGVSGLKLPDGTELAMVEDIQCGISEDRADAAHNWLVEHGYGGIIRSNINIDFPAEEIEEARKLASQIEGISGRTVLLKGKVHPQTLKAFLKERLAAGEAIPLETFGVHPFNKVKFEKKAKRAA